jgi:3-hydroxyisobutyrate dehydrogenase
MAIKTIGFIGTGVMGKGMARNLMKAGYSLNVYTRTKSKAADLVSEGALWKNSPSEVAQDSDVVITIVGYPKDVEEVYLGDNGIINKAREGTYVIDMTTSSPKLSEKIYSEAKAKNIYAIDAPVSGGDIGARDGKLSIMVGGDEEAFNEVKPIFDAMGTNIVYQGKAGAGQHTKLCNQITLANNMVGVTEAIVYADKAGLDANTVLKSISSGAAGSWALTNLAPKMIDGDDAPGFYVKHFIKDMMIALQSAEDMGLLTPGLKQTKRLYEELAEIGEDNSGTQALYKWYVNQKVVH